MIRQVFAVLHPCVAGLDVHKRMVMACRRRLLADGRVEAQVQEFGTTTAQLRTLQAWLGEWGVTHVAMESTGVLWVPVWNILADSFPLLLANAQQLRKVPGRKSDVRDAEWLAQLLQCGLLRPSFVPSPEVRAWRELTRQRMKLIDQHTSVVNRIQKVLQQGNLKLSSAASDVMGVSGRAILRSLISGQRDPEQLAQLAQGRLRATHADLVESLEGCLREEQCWLLRQLWQQVGFLEQQVAAYNQRLAVAMRAEEALLKRLVRIPGINRRSAENLLAELGPDMGQFPATGGWSVGRAYVQAATSRRARTARAGPRRGIAGCGGPCSNPPGVQRGKKIVIWRPCIGGWRRAAARNGRSSRWRGRS